VKFQFRVNNVQIAVALRAGKAIEPYGEGGKYKLIFSMKAKPIGPIPFADAPPGAMQGPRYTTFAKLTTAKKLTDLTGKP